MRPEQHTFPLFAYLILIIALGAAPGVLAQDNPTHSLSCLPLSSEDSFSLSHDNPLDISTDEQRETALKPLFDQDNPLGFSTDKQREMALEPLFDQDNPLGFSSDKQKKGEKQQKLEQVDPLDSLQKRLEMQRQTELLPLLEPDNEIRIKLLENRLTLENIPEDGVLEIYNIMGVKVYSQRIKAGIAEVTLTVPRGYYIIKIGKFTRKIAIK